MFNNLNVKNYNNNNNNKLKNNKIKLNDNNIVNINIDSNWKNNKPLLYNHSTQTNNIEKKNIACQSIKKKNQRIQTINPAENFNGNEKLNDNTIKSLLKFLKNIENTLMNELNSNNNMFDNYYVDWKSDNDNVIRLFSLSHKSITEPSNKNIDPLYCT